MTFCKSLAVAGLTALANAKTLHVSQPKVASYANQYDMINNDYVHALFASVYDIGGHTEWYQDTPEPGIVANGWRMEAFGKWSVNFAAQFMEVAYVNVKTTMTLADGHHNFYLSMPDYID
jgi:hypothetical protein